MNYSLGKQAPVRKLDKFPTVIMSSTIGYTRGVLSSSSSSFMKPQVSHSVHD